MIDFGSLHEINLSFSPNAKTIRYCSVNAFAERPVSAKDDLQSLGFVLLDAYCGFQHSPLNEPQTEVTKQQLCLNACARKYGGFFCEYFSLLESGHNVHEELLQLAHHYQSKK